MKLCGLALFAGSLAVAQAVISTTTRDINGNPIQEPSTIVSKGGNTEVTQSINGRQIPLQQIEEKVIRQDASGKVTERIIKKFDQTGHLSETQRVVTTEQKTPSGSSIQETTYSSDVNGQMRETERKNVNTRTQGAVTESDTVIERPSINGSFQTAEKRNSVTVAANGKTHEEETVYQRSQGGDLYQTLREVTEEEKNGNQVISKTESYEPAGVTGSLQLARQTVSTTTARPDGSQVSEVNMYGRAAYGRVQEPGAPLQIREQQIIERQKGAGGSIVETLSVRRPSISEPNRLGGLQKISETVCTGKCQGEVQP